MKHTLPIVSVIVVLAATLAACTPGLNTTLAGAGSPVEPASSEPQVAAPPQRTLNVSGPGKVFITPDIAYINIGVHTEHEDVGQALDLNNQQAQEVVNALRNRGVDPKDIQTSSFNIYPNQQYSPSGEQLGTRYVVDNMVYVTVRDLSALGTLLETVVSSGANSINGISFDVEDKTQATADARKQAIDQARKLAQEMAAAAGVELGQVVNINVSISQSFSPYDMYGRGGGNGAAVAAEVPISSGQMVISAEVALTYEIQ
jgi:uncharacterized protein YggE